MEAVVPAGTRPGSYAIVVTSPFGQTTQSAFTVEVVTAATAPTLTAVEPAVIDRRAEVVILGSGFLPTSEPKLVSKATSALIAFESVTYESPTRLRAVVPQGTQPGIYGVNVSDLLAPRCPAEKDSLLTVSQAELPRVRTLLSDTFTAGEAFTLFACGQGLVASKAEVVTLTGLVALTTIDPPTATCPAGDETLQLSGSPLAAGRYGLRFTNKSDPAVFSFFDAINVVDGVVSATSAASPLVRARRGAAVAAGRMQNGRVVVYAVGGDQPANDTDGKRASVVGTPLASVEYAVAGFDGQSEVLSAFSESRTSLPEGRYGATAAVIGGKFLYVFGGQTETGVASTVQRAPILREEPIAAPQLTTAAGALPVGRYVYVVSAIMGAADADNPGGETLPSARASVVVTRESAITLSFLPLTGAESYRVYRTPAPPDADAGTLGKLRYIGDINACEQACSYTDNTAAVGSEHPLELGALGRFSSFSVANAPALFGLASEVVQDSLFLTGGSTDGVSASTQITRLRVRADGGLDAGDTSQSLPAPAFQHTSVFAARVGTPTKPRLYALFGLTAAQYHHAEVTTAGPLSSFTSDATPGLPQIAGAPGASFARKLLLFGGLTGTSLSASILLGDTGANGNATFAPTSLALTTPRYLSGAARVGASVFVIGGYGCGGATCATVERVSVR
jgi:hypothetical protein